MTIIHFPKDKDCLALDQFFFENHRFALIEPVDHLAQSLEYSTLLIRESNFKFLLVNPSLRLKLELGYNFLHFLLMESEQILTNFLL